MASSRDDKKKFIGDLLKAADRHIKAEEYSEAMVEVNKALAVEPGNMYALAYNQRIKSALDALRKKEEELRVKKISAEKQAAAKGAVLAEEDEAARSDADPDAAAAAEASPGPGANEDDRYTIRQQRAQIERFKEELESLRLKHQQEIAVLAAEVQQARGAEKEAADKYRVVVDDAEESYRRTEELYAEVVRLNERITEMKNTVEAERESRTAEQQQAIRHLEGERETMATKHRQELSRRDEERGSLTGDLERERRRLDEERVRITAEHQQELNRREAEREALIAAQKQELQAVRDEFRNMQQEYARIELEVKQAAAENESLRAALARQEPSSVEPAADDDVRRRIFGEAILRAIYTNLYQSDVVIADHAAILNMLRAEIGVADEDVVRLQTEAKHGIYRVALKDAWEDGYITPEKAETLAQLRKKIGISPELHFVIEDELRSAKKKR